MSESNNNIPLRITQLEKASDYEEGSVFAIAQAGKGTKQISTNTPTPPHKRLMSDFNMNMGFLEISNPTTGFIDKNGDINSSVIYWTYTTVRLEDINATYFANGFSWYGNVKPFVFITDTNKIIYPEVDGGSTPLYYDYISFNIYESGTLYLNRYGTSKIINAYKKTIISEKSSARGFEKLTAFHSEMINTLYLTKNENISYDEKLTGYLLDGDTGKPKFFESDVNSPYIVEKYSINAFDTYHIKSSHWYGNAIFSIFDEDDRLLYKENAAGGGTYTSYDDDYSMPFNASYCYISYVKSHAVGTIVQVLPQISTENKKYLGKKWIAFGDSLTSFATLGADPNYVNYLTDILGFTTYNKGVGGTGYWKGHSSDQAFYQRAGAFTEDADIITILGSFNDLGTEEGVSGAGILGNYTDNTTATVCGCINQTLDALMSMYPSAILGIVAPTPWSNSHDSTACETYVSKLKQIADYRSIPFLDLYHSSNIRPWDETFRALFMRNSDDGAHPNSEGHKRIAVQFIDFINKIFYSY